MNALISEETETQKTAIFNYNLDYSLWRRFHNTRRFLEMGKREFAQLIIERGLDSLPQETKDMVEKIEELKKMKSSGGNSGGTGKG